MASTIRLHRVLRATPERVYRAFLDPDAMVKWLPPNGFTAKVHHMDARVGGSHRMSFTNFTTGTTHSFGGEYVELFPHECIRYTDKFDDPNLPGTMQVTVALKEVSCGTELSITQEGLPDVIPLEACYLGWKESLALLAKLVEGGDPGGGRTGHGGTSCSPRRTAVLALERAIRPQKWPAKGPADARSWSEIEWDHDLAEVRPNDSRKLRDSARS